jgi:TolB-like protein
VAPAASTDASATTPAQKSIAVLAFTDLSPAKDQEYFSDGIAEEILNALVKVKDLKVAGRTSSFYFKGKNEDLRKIGETLGVAHILEGSVRKQGEKVRITAQLVKADDGFHLWSETYDGDLADVFELQEQIARKITGELQLMLQGDQQTRLVPVATADPEGYTKFLQATAIFNRRERARFPDAIALLEDSIRLDPDFARAHARLGALHVLSSEYTGADREASIGAARLHANRAIELLPTLAEPHAVLAYAHGLRREFVAEREAYERGLAVDPNDVLCNFWSGLWYVRMGYGIEAVRHLDRLLEIDPMLPNGLNWRGWLYVYEGDWVNARRVVGRALDLGLAPGHLGMAFIEEAEGRNDRAIAEMQLGYAAFGAGMLEETPAIVAAGIFGDEAARLAAAQHLESVVAGRKDDVLGPIPFGLIMLGEHERALELLESGFTSSSIWQLGLWHPRGLAARRLPQFAEFARRVGFAQTWDKYGPPDGCRKTEGGDYVCD